MTTQDMTKAARIIRRHYGLNRKVTMAETLAEIANLKRKHAKENLDDMDERLYYALEAQS